MLALKKTVAHLIVASSLIASADAFAKYTEVRRLGTSEAICKGGVKNAAEFQAWTAANKSTINTILSTTKLAGQADAIVAAIARGEFTEKEYNPGTKFKWMAANKKGVPTAQRDRIWAGKEAFIGYEMFVEINGSRYEIVIPKVCCNFSLASIETVVQPEPEPAPVVAPEPEPTPEPIPEPIVKKKKKGITPFVSVTVGSESLERFELSWDDFVQDSSGFVGLRAGIKIPVGSGWSLVPAIGVIDRNGINDGNIFPETTFNIDFGVEKQFTKLLFGGVGVGIWNVDESDFREGSAYINGGLTITKNVDWITEARFIDANSSGTAVSTGVRFNF